MVAYPCWHPNCEFKVEDAPHVDACIVALKEHYRGAHPTKYLNTKSVGESVARYNTTFEEYMEINLGVEWQDPRFLADATHYAKAISRDDRKPNYCEATIAAAKAWLVAHGYDPAQEVAAAGNGAAQPFPARPAPARPRLRPRIR